MPRKHYPSDISREQLERIVPLLENTRHKTRPQRVDLYDVFCGVRDILEATVEVAKRSELHKFAVIPTRWVVVVARSLGWLEKCRRL